MRWKTFAIVYLLALAILLFAERRSATPPSRQFSGIVDLTRTVLPQTFVPQRAAERVRILQPASFEPSTRLIAPVEFAPSLWSVDQIPPERLVGPLAVLDVQSKSSAQPGYQISVDDIADWEQAHGEMPPGSIVLARTGYTAGARDIAFAGFSLDAARFLVESRKVFGLGTDSPSIDSALSNGHPVQSYLGEHSVYALEDVGNLERAPLSGGVALIAPLKLQGGSAAATRVFALLR